MTNGHSADSTSVFYLNYLEYEHLLSTDSDPHERLNCFYLAIMDAVYKKDYKRAFEVYQDLVSKKEAFSTPEYAFQEELVDLQQEIVQTIASCGFQASVAEFAT